MVYIPSLLTLEISTTFVIHILYTYLQILNIKHPETQKMHVCIDKYSNFSSTHVDPLRYFQVL